MKTHFDKTQELIIDIVKNGNLELLSSRIKMLEEKIEDRTDTLDNWSSKSPQEFEAFNRLEVQMWQVELDMLMDKKFKFINK